MITWKENLYSTFVGMRGRFQVAIVYHISGKVPWRARVSLFGVVWFADYETLEEAQDACGEMVDMFINELGYHA